MSVYLYQQNEAIVPQLKRQNKMTQVQKTKDQLADLTYKYDSGLITKADFDAQCFAIYKESNRVAATLNKGRQEYEFYLAQYISGGKGVVSSVRNRFTGDQWKLGKQSMISADLDPYAMKEAYLKACDFFGIERPKTERFVEESEAKLDAPFWETGVNPMTMTKVENYSAFLEPEDTFVDYNYTF